MTEEEALLRAREAYRTTYREVYGVDERPSEDAEPGSMTAIAVRAAQIALLDIDKPLPVDPDLEALREIVAAWDEATGAQYNAQCVRDGIQDDRIIATVLPLFRKHIEARAKG